MFTRVQARSCNEGVTHGRPRHLELRLLAGPKSALEIRICIGLDRCVGVRGSRETGNGSVVDRSIVFVVLGLLFDLVMLVG